MAIAIERKCALAEEIENLCSRCDSGRKWPQRSGRKKETLGDIQEEFVVVPILLFDAAYFFFFLFSFFFFFIFAKVELWLKSNFTKRANKREVFTLGMYLFSFLLLHFNRIESFYFVWPKQNYRGNFSLCKTWWVLQNSFNIVFPKVKLKLLTRNPYHLCMTWIPNFNMITFILKNSVIFAP